MLLIDDSDIQAKTIVEQASEEELRKEMRAYEAEFGIRNSPLRKSDAEEAAGQNPEGNAVPVVPTPETITPDNQGIEIKAGEEAKLPEQTDVKVDIDLNKDASELFAADKFGLTTIDEQFIAKLSDKDRDALVSLKGQKASPQVIKNYLSGQRLIAERKNPAPEQQKPIEVKQQEPVITKPIQETKQQPVEVKLAPELQDSADALLVAQLKQKYPEILKDAKSLDDIDEAISDLQATKPTRAYSILDDIKTTRIEINNKVNEINHYRTNYESVINQNVAAAKDAFTALAEQNGVDLSSIGVDLNAVDADGNNAFLMSLLYDTNGDPNPNVISFGQPGTPVAGIPFVSTQSVLNEMIQRVFPTVLKHQSQTVSSKEAAFQAQLAAKEQEFEAKLKAAKQEGYNEGLRALEGNRNSLPIMPDSSQGVKDFDPAEAGGLPNLDDPVSRAKFNSNFLASLGIKQ